jgi:hypothetical protein
LGDPVAQYNIAIFYAEGFGVPKDLSKAKELVEKLSGEAKMDAKVRTKQRRISLPDLRSKLQPFYSTPNMPTSPSTKSL